MYLYYTHRKHRVSIHTVNTVFKFETLKLWYLSIYLCMYVCVYVCMYACMYACIYIYIYIHIFTFTPHFCCAQRYVCMYIRIYVYKQTHRHTHIYTHMYSNFSPRAARRSRGSCSIFRDIGADFSASFKKNLFAARGAQKQRVLFHGEPQCRGCCCTLRLICTQHRLRASSHCKRERTNWLSARSTHTPTHK